MKSNCNETERHPYSKGYSITAFASVKQPRMHYRISWSNQHFNIICFLIYSMYTSHFIQVMILNFIQQSDSPLQSFAIRQRNVCSWKTSSKNIKYLSTNSAPRACLKTHFLREKKKKKENHFEGEEKHNILLSSDLKI